MAWLVQPIATFMNPGTQDATKTRLLAQLKRLGIHAEQQQANPFIVAECITECLNLGLWRCLSDRLEVRLEEIEASQTRVTINAVPNLLRTGIRAGERVTDRDFLVAELQSGRP